MSIAPSEIGIDYNKVPRKREFPNYTPKAADEDDIKKIISDFRAGAERAKRAGFDGIEVHAAGGYLLD